MSIHHDAFHILHVIDRDLRFFTPDEQHHLYHLRILKHKEQRQLGKLIKETHQHIQKILSSQLQTTGVTLLGEGTLATVAQQQQQQQQSVIDGFFQHKRTKQLYVKLKDIKDRYHEMMQQQQIRPLENDMERYQQLQVIHGLSSRLDASSQVYDELHYLRLAILSLHRQWKLDRIQQMVNTLATTFQSSAPNQTPLATSSSPSSSTAMSPLQPTSLPLSSNISNQHSHRWYPSVRKLRKSSSSSTPLSPDGFFSTVKKWFKYPTSPGNMNRAEKKSTTTAAAGTNNANESIIEITQGHQLHRRSQPHSHLLCASQDECKAKILQIIHDFYDIFEENARQNEQRMHQMYARAFEPDVDPMLAEDIQRLCQSITNAPPPSLTSLTQPGVSFAFSWNFGLPANTIRCSFDDNNSNTILSHQTTHEHLSYSSLILPPTPMPTNTKPILSTKDQGKSRSKWIWYRGTSNTKKRQQKDPLIPSTTHHPHQLWSICLGLLSEHLLHTGQLYYTRWLQELTKAQQQQTSPFQVATETLASMYKALQIEQGHAVLSNLCTQLESSTI